MILRKKFPGHRYRQRIGTILLSRGGFHILSIAGIKNYGIIPGYILTGSDCPYL